MRYLDVYECENEELEELGIDVCDLSNDVAVIARDGGVNILSDKNLVGVLSTDTYEPVGGLWISNHPDSFSFDIAIDKNHQRNGYSHTLINAALEEYKIQNEYYHDMNGTSLPMAIDVINPSLAQSLIKHYNFQVDRRVGPDRVIMSLIGESKANIKDIFNKIIQG